MIINYKVLKDKNFIQIFILVIFLFGATNLIAKNQKISTLASLKFNVNEQSRVNNKDVSTEYVLSLELPKILKKEVLSPKEKKGEIYIYENGMKTIFLPFFNQVIKEKSDENEMKILNFINQIVELDKKDKNFKEKYYLKEYREFQISNSWKIVIKEFQTVKSYLIPKILEVYSGTTHVSTLNLSNVEVNPSFKKEDFILKE